MKKIGKTSTQLKAKFTGNPHLQWLKKTWFPLKNSEKTNPVINCCFRFNQQPNDHQPRSIKVPLGCNGSLAIFTKETPLRVRGPSTTSAAADHSKPKGKAVDGAMTTVAKTK